MIHIEIQPSAIATFESQPTAEAIETLRGVVEYFADPIEKFLKDNESDIPPENRAKARQSAARAILSDDAGIDTSMIPGHLRDAFRRLVIQAAYWKRSQGKRFDPDADYMPIQGGAKSSTINTARI